MIILIIDDNRDFTNKQCELLSNEGYGVTAAYSESEARECLNENGKDIGIALIDMYMESKDSGLKLVRLVKESYPWIVPIVITGYTDFEDAARCMEEGCFSYIMKEKISLDLFLQTIKKAVERHQFLTEIPRFKSGLAELRKQFVELTKKMNEMISTLGRIEDEISFVDTQGKNEKPNQI
jgi:DNA-binding NtrC family response regulator